MTSSACGALAFAALQALAAGCAESTLEDPRDAGSVQDAAPAAPRVLERRVRVDMPNAVYRRLTADSEGEQKWDEPVELEGLQVCIVQQRPAFANFELFEELDPPICATPDAGAEVVSLPGAPANSDLVITYNAPGYRPFVLTNRTGEFDVPIPGSVGGNKILMHKPGETDPWVRNRGSVDAADSATVTFVVGSIPTGIGPTAPGAYDAPDVGYVVPRLVRGLPVTIGPQMGKEIQTTTAEHVRYVFVPRGSARIQLSGTNAHQTCATNGALIGLTLTGELEFELPILPGHDHAIAAWCQCRWSPEEELTDLGTCSVRTLEPSAP